MLFVNVTNINISILLKMKFCDRYKSRIYYCNYDENKCITERIVNDIVVCYHSKNNIVY